MGTRRLLKSSLLNMLALCWTNPRILLLGSEFEERRNRKDKVERSIINLKKRRNRKDKAGRSKIKKSMEKSLILAKLIYYLGRLIVDSDAKTRKKHFILLQVAVLNEMIWRIETRSNTTRQEGREARKARKVDMTFEKKREIKNND